MPLSSLTAPTLILIRQLQDGERPARQSFRSFLYQLLAAAQVVEADVATAQADVTAAQADATQALADAATAQADADAVISRFENGAATWAHLDDGTTDGKIKITAAVDFRVAGRLYNKAATDDLFDLSGETDTIAAQYRAYWLYLNTSGTASIAAGANAASEAAAIAALPALAASKSVIGVYVAGPSCDFNGVAGLAAQGTVINGWPDSVA